MVTIRFAVRCNIDQLIPSAAIVEGARQSTGKPRPVPQKLFKRHRLGHGSESDKALVSLLAREKGTQVVEVAEVHAVRGEIDLAFEWLERAYASRDAGIAQIKALRYLGPLHGDPRWPAFLARLRLDS